MNINPSQPEMSDEELDELLKDPEFVKKPDGTPRQRRSETQKRLPALLFSWPALCHAAVMALVSLVFQAILIASELHKVPMSAPISGVLDSMGVKHGNSFYETILVRLASPSGVVSLLFLIPVCWLYLQPNKAASRLAFWLLLPLVLVPRVFLLPMEVIGAVTNAQVKLDRSMLDAIWSMVSMVLKQLFFCWAILYISGRVSKAISGRKARSHEA